MTRLVERWTAEEKMTYSGLGLIVGFCLLFKCCLLCKSHRVQLGVNPFLSRPFRQSVIVPRGTGAYIFWIFAYRSVAPRFDLQSVLEAILNLVKVTRELLLAPCCLFYLGNRKMGKLFYRLVRPDHQSSAPILMTVLKRGFNLIRESHPASCR